VTAPVRVAAVVLPEVAAGAAVADADRVAGYLAAGTVILFTTATTADRYAPDRGAPVGLSVRSDGVWVWSDMIGYYTATYGIPPEPDLLAHIRANGYACPALDDATARRTVDAFYAAREG
jgi:hypothetical protein